MLIVGLSVASPSAAGSAGQPLYPNLKTLPPSSISLDAEEIEGTTHYVMRFSNTVVNVGPGRLELRGESNPDTGRTIAYQRLYDRDDQLVSETAVGEFDFHPAHNHWHFENFAHYEIWKKSDYDHWLKSHRRVGEPLRDQGKVSFCILDTLQLKPKSLAHYHACGLAIQGLAAGWGDIYGFSLPEQWVDMGEQPLPNGQYVLRSVVDPDQILAESDGSRKSAHRRDSAGANEAATIFTIDANRVVEPR